MSDVTRILDALREGDDGAADRLLETVYDELRGLASRKLARERPGQTLQATALVHEAWLRLAGGGAVGWDGRGHFFAAAAEAMRRILIERARRRARLKHGGGRHRVDMDDVEDQYVDLPVSLDVLALDEAMSRLAVEDRTKADLVKLRFYAGLTVEEAARVLGVSRATADRHWAYARAWLYHEMSAN